MLMKPSPLNRYFRSTLSPLRSFCELASIVSPSGYWQRVNKLARTSGLKQLYLFLSFDCDTEEDAAVVLDLDLRLREMGLHPAYAVPAELLKKNEKTYGVLRDRSANFLNHGYKIHTIRNKMTGHYKSTFSYRELPKGRVAEDIEKGHELLRSFLGECPKGFRAPHFGTFQLRSELLFLHQKLQELGYRYSSSTSPVFAFMYGPLFYRFGLLEIPVSGTTSKPREIYDSFGFFAAPKRKWREGDYLSEATKRVRLEREVGIINLYADPSQVWNRSEFFEALKLFLSIAVSRNFDEVESLMEVPSGTAPFLENVPA